MAPRKPAPRKPAPKPSRAKPSRPVDADRVTLRGLDARDLAALDALTAKRRADLGDLGAGLSRNVVVVALMRDALRREGAYDLPAVEPGP